MVCCGCDQLVLTAGESWGLSSAWDADKCVFYGVLNANAMLTLSSVFTHICGRGRELCRLSLSIFSAHPLILHPGFDLVPSEMVSENDDESERSANKGPAGEGMTLIFRAIRHQRNDLMLLLPPSGCDFHNFTQS